MKRLNGMDAILLYSEAPNVHTHTLKVAIVDNADGHFTLKVFREAIAQRLHLLEPLSYKLIDIPGRLHHPMWLENCPVDLGYHVRSNHVQGTGDREDLDKTIGEVASTPLDRRYPLWEFYYAEGLAERKVALIGKIHHALADGVASANLLARLMDDADVPPGRHLPPDTCTPPSSRQLLSRYDHRADHPLVASVPTSTESSPDRISGNELGEIQVSLPVHIGDPLERVRLTALATRVAKDDQQLLGPALSGRLMDYLPPALAVPTLHWLAKNDTNRRLMNLPISNVRGPRQFGYIAGARVTELYSVGPLTPGCGVNITVWSYVDDLTIAVIADDLTLDAPDELTNAIVEAFSEIRGASTALLEPAKTRLER